MCEAPLPRRARETGLDSLDDAGRAVDKQIDDVVPAQIAGGEILVVSSELLAKFRHGGALEQTAPGGMPFQVCLSGHL